MAGDWQGHGVEIASLLMANSEVHKALQSDSALYIAIFKAASAADTLTKICESALTKKFTREDQPEPHETVN